MRRRIIDGVEHPPAAPRWATPRSSLPTRGPQLAVVLDVLGLPAMPHQRQILDTAGEYDPDTGKPIYREVWVVMPRQNGKTALMLSITLDRALQWPVPLDIAPHPRRVIYTAQTGEAAEQKMLFDWLPAVEASDYRGGLTQVHKRRGSVAFSWRNGSRIEAKSSSETAVHGGIIDMAVWDEAFADEDARREQAAVPAAATRSHAQFWGLSTAGTERSLWLNNKIRLGRALVDAGECADHRIAFFEWSAVPGYDRTDESLWPTFIPALGFLFDVDVVRHALTSSEDPADFDRAWGCVTNSSLETVIPTAAWRAVRRDGPVSPRGPRLVLGIDADVNLTTAAVVAADVEGRIKMIERVDYSDLAPTVAQAAGATNAAAVAVDARGPLLPLFDELDTAIGGRPLIQLGTEDMCTAAADLYLAVGDRTMRVGPDPALDLAAGAAARRPIGDRWIWHRTVDAVPILAASIALSTARRGDLLATRTPTTFVLDPWARDRAG